MVLCAASLCILLIVAAALVWYSDASRLQALVSPIVLDTTGRNLRFDQFEVIEVSTTPVLRLGTVSLSNPEWADAENFLEADQLTVSVDLSQLRIGQLYIRSIKVAGLALSFENQPGMAPTWVFTTAEEAPAGDDKESPFFIQDLTIADARISVRVNDLQPFVIRLDSLVQRANSADQLVLAANGFVDERSLSVEGNLGTLDSLLTQRDIELDLALQVERTLASLSGSIADLDALSDVDIAFSLQGPDAGFYGNLLGRPELFTGGVAISGSVKPADLGSLIHVDGFVGEYQSQVSVTMADLAVLDNLSGSVLLQGPDISVLNPVLGIEVFPAGVFEVQGSFVFGDGDFDITQMTVDAPGLTANLSADFHDFPNTRDATVDVLIRSNDLDLYLETMGLSVPNEYPLELSLALNSDDLVVDVVLGGRHSLRVSGGLTSMVGAALTDVAITLRGDEIADLLKIVDVTDTLSGPYELSVKGTLTEDELLLKDMNAQTEFVRVEGVQVDVLLNPHLSLKSSGLIHVASVQALAQQFSIDDLPNHPATLDYRLTGDENEINLTEVELKMAGIAATIQSVLTFNPATQASLTLSVSGEDLSILRIDEVPFLDRPFTAEAGFEIRDDQIDVLNLDFRAEDVVFSAAGTILPGVRAGSILKMVLSGDSLEALVAHERIVSLVDSSFSAAATVQFASDEVLLIEDSTLQVGLLDVAATGRVNVKTQVLEALNLTSSGSLDEIGAIFGQPLPDTPFELALGLTDTNKEKIEIVDLTANFGVSDISMEGVVRLGGKPDVQARLSSNVLDVSDIVAALFPEVAATQAGAPVPTTRSPEKFFPSDPIPITLLDIANLDIEMQVGRYRGVVVRIDDIELDATLVDGEILLNRLAYRDEIGAMKSAGRMDKQGDVARLSLQFMGQDADLGLFRVHGQTNDLVPRYQIEANVKGQGSTVAQLVGSLDGEVMISSSGGKINNSAVQLLMGDFLSSVFSTLNPFVTSEPTTDMQCLVLNASIDEGHVTLKPGFVMQTDKVNMFVSGRIDLGAESLDVSLATQARKGLGIGVSNIVNPYFKVGGSFLKPQLQLNPTSAALNYGVVSATGGLSILAKSFWDRYRGSKNPCKDFSDQWEAREPNS